MNLDHVFVCGHPALDFAATLRARRTLRFEMFVTPDRLTAWYVESGVVDAVSPGEEDDVEQAKGVREAIYRLVTARRLGEEYDGSALTVVNNAARHPAAVPQLTPLRALDAGDAAGGALPGRPSGRRTAQRAGRAAAQGVRQPGVHAHLHRPLAGDAAAVVRHGVLRQQDQGGGVPGAEKAAA